MKDQQNETRQHPSSFDDLGGSNRTQRRSIGIGGKRDGKASGRRAAIRAALPHAPDLTAEEQVVADAITDRITDGAGRLATVHRNGRDDLVALLVRTVSQRAVAAMYPGQRGDDRVDYLGVGHPDADPQELTGPTDAYEWLEREQAAGRPARVVIRTTTLRELR